MTALSADEADFVDAMIDGDMAGFKSAGSLLGDEGLYYAVVAIFLVTIGLRYSDRPSDVELAAWGRSVADRLDGGGYNPVLIEAVLRSGYGDDEALHGINVATATDMRLAIIGTFFHERDVTSSERARIHAEVGEILHA